MTIKRYSLMPTHMQGGGLDIVEQELPDGEWVRFDDLMQEPSAVTLIEIARIIAYAHQTDQPFQLTARDCIRAYQQALRGVV